MSKKNNINPDYYKIKGRDRPNVDIVPGKVAPSPPEPRAPRPRKAATPPIGRTARQPKSDNQT